jgi:hypothetical protein
MCNICFSVDDPLLAAESLISSLGLNQSGTSQTPPLIFDVGMIKSNWTENVNNIIDSC